MGWQWFITLTFAEPANDYRATRAVKIWFAQVRKVYKPAAMVYVLEPHRYQEGAYHIHGLVKFGPMLLPAWRKVGELCWKWGFVRIYPVLNQNAAKYVTKYMFKHSEVEWDFLGDIDLLRHHVPVEKGQVVS